MIKVAILITCHNRKLKTLSCLEALHGSNLPKNYQIETYLVDDGSSDGTANAVGFQFPSVEVIEGSGNLFWNQGMRLAWFTAAQHKEYNFYLWLNDDTIIEDDALEVLFENYRKASQMDNMPVLMVGACKESFDVNKFSYGGRNENGPVVPNGEVQKCKFINGNVVLVPKAIFKDLGYLSNDYTHGIGDYDYGLRVQNNGYSCYTTSQYIAVCPTHKNISTWCNPEKSLSERWEHFNSPLGLNFNEYVRFRKKFWGNEWIIYAFKAYCKMLFPKFYNKFLT